MMNEDLKNKVAIVTGSTSGIGEAIVRTLARQGAHVLVSGRDVQRGSQIVEDIRGSGGSAIFVQADLLDKEAPNILVKQAIDAWGRIDVVVNNAALICNKPVENLEHDDWDRLFTVNVKAGFFVVQAALPWLKKVKGNVINISSTNGMINDNNNVVYDTMKAALNHMTRGLSLDLRKDGIRCNVLMPGGIATPLVNQWFQQKIDDPKEAERIAESVKAEPSIGMPQQVADAVLLLCSEYASWVNGALVPVDGGYHIGYPVGSN